MKKSNAKKALARKITLAAPAPDAVALAASQRRISSLVTAALDQSAKDQKLPADRFEVLAQARYELELASEAAWEMILERHPEWRKNKPGYWTGATSDSGADGAS